MLPESSPAALRPCCIMPRGPRPKRCRREDAQLGLCRAPVLVGRVLALRTKVGERQQQQGAAAGVGLESLWLLGARAKAPRSSTPVAEVQQQVYNPWLNAVLRPLLLRIKGKTPKDIAR